MAFGQLPTPWDPQGFFLHLIAWAGVPAVAVAIMAAVLGIINAVKGWIGFGKATVTAGGIARKTIVNWTTRRQRAAVQLFFYSITAVAFAYMLAVVMVGAVRLGNEDLFTPQAVANQVGVAPWPTAAVWTVFGGVCGIGLLGLADIGGLQGLRKLVTGLGKLALAAAWLVLVYLGIAAACMWLALAIGGSGGPGLPLTVTTTITAAMAGVLVLVMPAIPDASAAAFSPS